MDSWGAGDPQMNEIINNSLMGLNEAGGVFYDYAASVFIQTALLVILLFVIDLLLRKRVRAVFRYCVWLLVLVKLILPPMLSLPTGIGYWAGDYISAAPGLSNRAFDPFALEHAGPSGEMPLGQPAENIARDNPANYRTGGSRTAPTPLTWQAVVFLLWLAGVLAFIAVLVQRIRFVKGLVAASCPAGDELTGLLEQSRRQMAVRREIKLRLSDTIPSPAVCGLLRPTVLMPTSLVERLSPEGLRATLIHELAHIKRGDLWVNSVQTFLQVVYFYNPFVWFANSVIRKVCEEAVDETVLVALGGRAKDYSNTLIDIGEMVFWKADLGLRLIGVAESKKALQWRIRHMLNRPIPKSSKLGALGIAMLLVIASVLLPMARAQKQGEDKITTTAVSDEKKSTDSLHHAAADGDLERVKLLLVKGLDVDTRDDRGMTPLHLAAEKGHKNVVEFLIAKGADVNVLHAGNATPAWLAMNNGHRDIVELLIQKGAKVLPMNLAACFGDTDRVRKLIRDGVDVNAKGEGAGKDRAALHWAVAHGHKDTVELLIKNGAIVSGRATTMWTPLHVAAGHEQKEMVELLIAHDADITAKDNNGYTPLHVVAWGDSVDVAEILIDAGADMNAEDNWGGTPLVMAIDCNRAELVALFIAKGMDPNRPISWGGTTLHRAAYTGSKDVIQLLISKGVKVNRKDDIGRTPIEIAIGFSRQVVSKTARLQTAKLLASHGAEIPPIHLAAYLGDIEKIKSLIKGGADVNARWLDFGTPLRAAAASDQKDIAELLITEGADVNVGNKSGGTPLHKAAQNGCDEVARLLIDKGADIHIEDSNGYPPVLVAATWKHQTVVDVLLDAGADINAKENREMTALHFLAWYGRQDSINMMEFLLARGADIEAKSMWDSTPLFFAVQNGKLESAQFLLSKGANINAKDNNGQTPLSVAKGRGRTEMVEFLLKHGAKEGSPSLHQAATDGDIERVKLFIAKGVDVNEKNQTGDTPLHLAVARNQKAIVALLIDKGADIEATCSRWGNPPLVFACAIGRRDIAELLLSKGADIEAKNSDGGTPLLMAAYSGKPEVAELLIKRGADIEGDDMGLTPLLRAAGRGHTNVVEVLLAHGADITAKLRGETAIHRAMTMNRKEMVRFLLTKGLETSPIHIAAYLGELDKVKGLVAQGVDINARDIAGFTPVYCATCGTEGDIVEFLLAKGANVNARTAEGRFPLINADIEIAELLITKGANVNLRHRLGQTVLHSAVNRNDHKGDVELVRLFLSHGADVNAKAYGNCVGWEGWTPFHVACRNGNEAIVEMLISKGADINTKTDKGYTPMSLAEENERKHIAELLREHGAKE